MKFGSRCFPLWHSCSCLGKGLFEGQEEFKLKEMQEELKRDKKSLRQETALVPGVRQAAKEVP